MQTIKLLGKKLVKQRKKFSIRIRHRANLTFDAYFHSSAEQMVVSVVLLIFIGVFTYPMYFSGRGFLFWVLCLAMVVILCSFLLDLYFVIYNFLKRPNKHGKSNES